MSKTARLKVPTREVTITDLAKAALDAAEGEILRAAELMEEEVRAAPQKYHELMDPRVRDACYDAVSQVVRGMRARIVESITKEPPKQHGDRVRKLASGNLCMLFPLPGGKPLAHATRADVLAGAEHYRKLAEDTHAKATWLARIAEKMKGDQVVSKVFDEATLRKMMADATGAAA